MMVQALEVNLLANIDAFLITTETDQVIKNIIWLVWAAEKIKLLYSEFVCQEVLMFAQFLEQCIFALQEYPRFCVFN